MFALYKQLSADLKKLPNYIGEVHRGTGYHYEMKED